MLPNAPKNPSACPIVTRDARSAAGDRSGQAALDDRGAAADRRPVELVGCSWCQRDPAFFAEHLDAETVHAADRNGAGPEPADRAAVHAKRDQRVVLEFAARNRRGEVGRQLADSWPQMIAGHVQRVDAAVRDDRGDAGLSFGS